MSILWIHFDFYLVHGNRYGSRFNLHTCDQFSQQYLFKKLFFLQCMFLGRIRWLILCWGSDDLMCLGSSSSVMLHFSVSLILCHYEAVVITVAFFSYVLKCGIVISLASFLLSQIAFDILGLSWLHINLRLVFCFL